MEKGGRERGREKGEREGGREGEWVNQENIGNVITGIQLISEFKLKNEGTKVN